VAVPNLPPDVLAHGPRASQYTPARPRSRRGRLGTATLQPPPASSHTHSRTKPHRRTFTLNIGLDIWPHEFVWHCDGQRAGGGIDATAAVLPMSSTGRKTSQATTDLIAARLQKPAYSRSTHNLVRIVRRDLCDILYARHTYLHAHAHTHTHIHTHTHSTNKTIILVFFVFVRTQKTSLKPTHTVANV